MSHNDYKIRTINSKSESNSLKELFTTVFYPEEVGLFAEVMFNHFPYTENKYWFVAEEEKTAQLVAGLTLIPWTWSYEGISLKIAEMGIVGTLENHRNKGLIRKLNEKFSETMKSENFHMSVIQGIPGFYHKIGYNYAVSLENHINLPLHIIDDIGDENLWTIRLCINKDIPWLIEQDEIYKDSYSLTTERNEKHWKFIFSYGKEAEYESEFWLIENSLDKRKFYFRISLTGFGEGLIIREVSDNISHDALPFLFSTFKKFAIERGKPYIRINLSENSIVGKRALSIGASFERPYGFQIKIPDKIFFLNEIKSVLEDRIFKSSYENLTDSICINFYDEQVHLKWKNGKVESISHEGDNPSYTISMRKECFEPLVTGYRSWKELQYLHHDVISSSVEAGELTDILFPKKDSWIYLQY